MMNRISGLITFGACAIGFAALAGCECECLQGLFSCDSEETAEVSFLEETTNELPGGYAGVEYAVDGDASFEMLSDTPPLLASGASR